VQIGGQADTIRRYFGAALIDVLHLAIPPALPGSGEQLCDGVDARKLGYHCSELVRTANANEANRRRGQVSSGSSRGRNCLGGVARSCWQRIA
jgi:dihydrofolate reductase